MNADWDALEREADRWAEAGRRIELWWRDDDAVADTRQLRQLIDRPVPVALAVIPEKLEQSLAQLISGKESVGVLQHGLAHRNLAPSGAKKSEFPPGQKLAEAIAGLARGRTILEAAFAGRLCPVLVPPWNRIDPALLPGLTQAGISCLSTYGPRRSPWAAPGLLQVNAHLDVIAWHQGRGFIGTAAAIQLLVQHLSAKRQGLADAGEPTGLLTHHLVHDTETWRFLDAFLTWAVGHGDIVWRSAQQLFASPQHR